MRKLILSNMMSLDAYYEGKDGSLGALFEYANPLYSHSPHFDMYQAERFRAADTLLISGRASFLGNMSYWTSVPNDPNATPIRREISQLLRDLPKVVISDKLTPDELAPWDNTRIISRADSFKELATLKAQDGKDIILYSARLLWHDLVAHDLLDEIHITIFPMLAGGGTPFFIGQPGVHLKLLGARTWEDCGNVTVSYAISRPPQG